MTRYTFSPPARPRGVLPLSPSWHCCVTCPRWVSVNIKLLLTYLSSSSPVGQGHNNVSPQGPVLNWGLSLTPRQPHLSQLGHHCLSPCHLWPSLPHFSRWCPSQCHFGDFAFGHSQDVSQPSQLSASDLKHYWCSHIKSYFLKTRSNFALLFKKFWIALRWSDGAALLCTGVVVNKPT